MDDQSTFKDTAIANRKRHYTNISRKVANASNVFTDDCTEDDTIVLNGKLQISGRLESVDGEHLTFIILEVKEL